MGEIAEMAEMGETAEWEKCGCVNDLVTNCKQIHQKVKYQIVNEIHDFFRGDDTF